jgi:hypothetical protein
MGYKNKQQRAERTRAQSVERFIRHGELPVKRWDSISLFATAKRMGDLVGVVSTTDTGYFGGVLPVVELRRFLVGETHVAEYLASTTTPGGPEVTRQQVTRWVGHALKKHYMLWQKGK